MKKGVFMEYLEYYLGFELGFWHYVGIVAFIIFILLEIFGDPLMKGENEYEGPAAFWFDVVDWTDFILMVLVILSAGFIEQEGRIWDIINSILRFIPLQGVPLYVTSLIMCIIGAGTTIIMFRKRQMNLFGLLYNGVLWAIFIPLDLWLIINSLS